MAINLKKSAAATSSNGINVRGSGGAINFRIGPPPPFTPLSLPGLAAWYKAETATVNESLVVTLWPDSSGNGADLGPVPGVSQPTLLINHIDFNSQNVLSLDGTQQLYKLLPSGLAGSDSAFSLYITAKPTAGSTRVAFGWGQSGPGDSVNVNWTINGAQAVVELTEGATMGSVQYVTDNSAQIFSAHLGQGQDILTQSEVRVNGAIPANLGGGASGTLSIPIPVPETRLGSYFGTPATSYVGLIAEILVYNAQHTNSERLQVTQYLAAKYGISI